MPMTIADNDRRIDYIEFPVTDVARAKQFYGAVFGWTFEDYGPDLSRRPNIRPDSELGPCVVPPDC